MATSTVNYGLKKPSYGDNADIAVINSNMDKIDAKMKEIEDAGGSGASTWAEVANKPFETVGSGLSVDESGALNVTGGGSGGSSVSWNQIQTRGTKIAEVTIDGTKTEVYAPTGGSVEPSGDPIKLIDAMASSEDSNGKVTCSSSLGTNYDAWMAFNDVSCDSECRNGWLASSSDESPYIQYEFKNGARCFDHISIETYNNASALTRNVTVQASNDASEWTDIRTAQIEFKQSTYNTVNVSISDRNYWKYIRLQFDGKMYLGVNQSACTLSKLSVYGYTDAYSPTGGSGGGGSVSTEILYTATGTSRAEIELSRPYTDFDYLAITILKYDDGGYYDFMHTFIDCAQQADIMNNNLFSGRTNTNIIDVWATADSFMRYKFTDATHITYPAASGSCAIYCIKGIKF